ncbi:hypothetical protein U9M48_024425 [Paspalum notatum var. saurae]|uniref:Uncharacterized protein n=1 Tax=Paspalum notatum var. saurae TaxID=547442 RepID=A0AAQ3TQR3_PASNO
MRGHRRFVVDLNFFFNSGEDPYSVPSTAGPTAEPATAEDGRRPPNPAPPRPTPGSHQPLSRRTPPALAPPRSASLPTPMARRRHAV